MPSLLHRLGYSVRRAIMVDTSHVAPGGSIDRKYRLGLISDVAGDVAGSIANAADGLVAGRVCERHGSGDDAQPERRAVVNRQSPIPTIRSRRDFLAALSNGAASEHLSTDLIVQLGLATKDLASFAVRGLFAPRRPWLTEPNTGTSAIFVDKFNPSRLKRFLQHFTRVIGYVRPECTFDALNGWERETGSQREVGLRPS